METKISSIEPLLERVEHYGKTNFELLKLKTLDKTADISSGLISRLFLVAIILLFIIMLNIAIALWLGELLGKSYFGFLVVAAFYGIAGTVLFFIHPYIKARVNDSIITQMLN